MASVAVPSRVSDALSGKSEQLTLGAYTQPDISYHPDEEKWKARSAKRLAEEPTLLVTPLPEGFPQILNSPLVWEGKDWTDESQWTYDLSEIQLQEIDAALKHFHALAVPQGRINQSTFSLPSLGPILKALSLELHNGRGFFVLRSLPVDAYSRADIILIYAGISSYIGSLRGVQDRDAGVLAHVKDLTGTHPAKAIGAPAYKTDKQVFHTDAGDIISLFALETAEEGGTSRISSSWRVYNELVQTRPDLIKTLSEPWTHDTYGGNTPLKIRPLLYSEDNHIIIQYARRIFTGLLGLPRSSDIPPITEAQAEALDTIHFLAEKYNLGLNFEKGDIQYINNLSIFHARDAFRDSSEKKRHLLRLWLRNEDLAWKLPEPLRETWEKLYYTAREDEQRFALEPEIRSASKGRGDHGETDEDGNIKPDTIITNVSGARRNSLDLKLR